MQTCSHLLKSLSIRRKDVSVWRTICFWNLSLQTKEKFLQIQKDELSFLLIINEKLSRNLIEFSVIFQRGHPNFTNFTNFTNRQTPSAVIFQISLTILFVYINTERKSIHHCWFISFLLGRQSEHFWVPQCKNLNVTNAFSPWSGRQSCFLALSFGESEKQHRALSEKKPNKQKTSLESNKVISQIKFCICDMLCHIWYVDIK